MHPSKEGRRTGASRCSRVGNPEGPRGAGRVFFAGNPLFWQGDFSFSVKERVIML